MNKKEINEILYLYKVNLYLYELDKYKTTIDNDFMTEENINIIEENYERLLSFSVKVAESYLNLKVSNKLNQINKIIENLKNKYNIIMCCKCGSSILSPIKKIECGHYIHNSICPNSEIKKNHCIICLQEHINNKSHKSIHTKHVSWSNN